MPMSLHPAAPLPQPAPSGLRLARPARRARHGSAGFTVIELIIVVAMIGILAVIAIRRIDVQRIEANGDMQAVASALMAAQRQAMAQQHNVIVEFDQNARLLRVIADTNNSFTYTVGEHARVVPLGQSIRFGLGTAPQRPFGSSPIDFTTTVGGNPSVVFYRNGTASEHGGVYLTTVRGASGDSTAAADTRAIEVSRVTGRVDVFRYTGSAWVQGF